MLAVVLEQLLDLLEARLEDVFEVLYRQWLFVACGDLNTVVVRLVDCLWQALIVE